MQQGPRCYFQTRTSTSMWLGISIHADDGLKITSQTLHQTLALVLRKKSHQPPRPPPLILLRNIHNEVVKKAQHSVADALPQRLVAIGWRPGRMVAFSHFKGHQGLYLRPCLQGKQTIFFRDEKVEPTRMYLWRV